MTDVAIAPAPMYTMTVDLSVLESLGINLYSNAAAVLSELVANAYDADATEVSISWERARRVVVSDNGVGMNVPEINDRFLTAGYKKRLIEGLESPRYGRPFMGRKGIGKLSVFSIADTVTVYTTKDRTTHGLRIEVGPLEQAIKDRKPYHPEPVEPPEEWRVPGTALVLDDLKSKRADLTVRALRKRLARRFDVITQGPDAQGPFRIIVNDVPLSYADRQELSQLEFIWEFGSRRLPDEALPDGVQRFVLPDNVLDEGRDWRVGGWIGTARRPTDLTDDPEAGSLKNVIVLARKRPIQEGIIDKLDFSRLFGNYVTGQIEADILDLDGDYADIATSDRQRLIEDDERVQKLQAFLRAAFVKASEEWSKLRPAKESKTALAQYPQLQDWVDGRPEWQREAAEKMIGTVASLELERATAAEDRATLFRSGILAFERVGLRQSAAELEQLSRVTAIDLLPLLGAQKEYEAGLWVDILRSRVEAISKFRAIVDADEKEKVLQRHLFEHLWLLDASWERAAVGGQMEQDLRRIHPDIFALDEAGNEITGRIDIRYATSSGRHVIVELKRYSVMPEIRDLREQGSKYARALQSVLTQQQKPAHDIEVIFVLGAPPRVADPGLETDLEVVRRRQLIDINGRYVFYDALISNAQHQYENYLNASDRAGELDRILNTLTIDET